MLNCQNNIYIFGLVKANPLNIIFKPNFVLLPFPLFHKCIGLDKHNQSLLD